MKVNLLYYLLLVRAEHMHEEHVTIEAIGVSGGTDMVYASQRFQLTIIRYFVEV
jgi:hypothetical protein